MIEKLKSRLSLKVFLITLLLIAACCAATYFCIAKFSPYIYTHELSEAEELAEIFSSELSYVGLDEAQYVIPFHIEILSRDFGDEFVFHIFQSSGQELALPNLDSFTGASLEDYGDAESSGQHKMRFAGSAKEYILLLTRNTGKESQVIQALQKSLPIMGAVILAVSAVAALFYTWYMTRPIKKISKISRRMADMDFSGLCPSGRTDEIGVLSDSLNELSQNLSRALEELREANKRLQGDIDRERQLERQRVEFFSAASHELKTPITIVKGQLQGMLYQVGRYRDRETYLAQSLETIETLEKMVRELLTVSRLDTPGFSCKMTSLSLSGLLEERLAALEDLFIQRNMTVEKSVDPEVSVLGDPPLLQKALDNLLENAALYSPPGGSVRVRLCCEGKKALLTIVNTGVHIPEEAIPELFEAFYRVDRSRNRQTGGTGLGLYIVKTILDLHGAGIEITNFSQGVAVSVRFSVST